MSQIIGLSNIERDLNRGMKYLITFSEGSFPIYRSFVLYRIPFNRHREDELFYAEILDIITPNKDYLLRMLKESKTSILLEKNESHISSSLIQGEYKDPANLSITYYDLPFLSVREDELQKSLQSLNDTIDELGVEALIDVSNNDRDRQQLNNCYSFQLAKDKKELSLVKGYHEFNDKKGN